MYCVGYIIGVVDASNLVCPENTVNVGQLSDIVIKYLKENPATRHYNATGLVQISLAPLFPCKK